MAFPLFLSYFYPDGFSLHGIRVQSPPMGPLNHIIFGKLIKQAFKLCIAIKHLDSSLEVNYTLLTGTLTH